MLMSRFHSFFLITALFVGVSACTKDLPPLVNSQSNLTAVIYVDGRPIAEGVIAKASPAYEAVTSWVKANPSNWTTSFVTYVPDILVLGDNFQINFRQDSVIFGYQNSQVKKHISQSDYANLRKTILAQIGK